MPLSADEQRRRLDAFVDQAIDRERLKRGDGHTLSDAAHQLVRWGQQDSDVRAALVSLLILPYVKERARVLGKTPARN